MTSSDTSTSQTPFNQSGTGQQHAEAFSSSTRNDSGSWYKPEIIIQVMSIVIMGVVGFFSAYILLKDDISTNKSEISVLKEKSQNIEDKLSDISEDIRKIPNVERELAVIKEKVSRNISDIKNNAYNKSLNGDAQKTRAR